MNTDNNVYCGIDASSTCTGICIFKGHNLIFYTAVRPNGKNWRERMFAEGKELDEILKKYKPCKIYMEDVPLSPSGGYKTAIILGGVQGFIYGIASGNKIPVDFISPNSWRSDIGLFDGTKEGKTRSFLKQKSVETANKLFNLNLVWKGLNSKYSEDDESDAILIAYSQIRKTKFGFKAKSHSK